MIDIEVQKKARRVICDILEGATFVFTDDLVDKIPTPDWDAHGVAVSFQGLNTGKIHMWAPPEIMSLFAANMLGLEEDDEKATEGGLDATKEVLNMVTGRFITEVYGEEEVYNLSIPEELSQSILIQDMKNEDALWVDADDSAVLFRFFLES